MRFRAIYEESKSEGMSPEDIAARHSVSVALILTQLQKGIEIEYEHTDDEVKATKIAMDHLAEFPNYYDELEKMEKGLENESISEAKVTSTDGQTYRSPKDAYKELLIAGVSDTEINKLFPTIKTPAHKFFLRAAKKLLGDGVLDAVKPEKKSIKTSANKAEDIKKKLKVGMVVRVRDNPEDGVIEDLYQNNARINFGNGNVFGIRYDRITGIVKVKKKKVPKIKYQKNISFENAKRLFDKAGDSYSEFIVGATDKYPSVMFHTSTEDWNGMQYGYVDERGSVDSWGQNVESTGDMKMAKKLGVKWILDELVVTDHDTPYEPAYPRKRFVVFETTDHSGNLAFVTIDGGTFVKAMPVPKGWKDGQPATFEEY